MGFDVRDAEALAGELLGATVYPELPRLLFGVSELNPDLPNPELLAEDVDLTAIRRQVQARLSSVGARQSTAKRAAVEAARQVAAHRAGRLCTPPEQPATTRDPRRDGSELGH